MDCRDAVGYKIPALLCTPFRTDLIDCLPVVLCDPIDRSRLGSPIPGILQARTLEWVAISFSNA